MKHPVFNWKRLFFILVLLPAIVFLVGLVAMIAAANIPGTYSSFNPAAGLDREIRHLRVFAHGKGATPDTWQRALSAGDPSGEYVAGNAGLIIPDWSAWSSSFLRVSLNGLHLGRILGAHLGTLNNLESVHVSGHSAGAFFAFGVCQGIKKLHPQIRVQTTYLAPLSLYGVVFRHYGTRRFGSCADFSDAYIDREDRTPGANQPLENAHSFDLTELRRSDPFKAYSAHLSPLYFYAQALVNARALLWVDNPRIKQLFPPGEVSKVSNPYHAFK